MLVTTCAMSNFQEFVPTVFTPTDAIASDRAYHLERRKRVRTTVHWPILFFRNRAGEGIESTTQNLSSTGFFCFSQQPFEAGEALFCTLRIPSHDPEGKERIWILECRVRVRRSEPASREGLFGVACEFEDYRLLASHHPGMQS
jgi:hypothetical protein